MRFPKRIVRLGSAFFYHLLMKSVGLIPFKRYAVAARLTASSYLKSTILSTGGGQWIIFPRVPSTWAFPFGLKEPNIYCHLKTLLKNADGFIDCGANLGWYSFLASGYDNIKNLVAIEPIPQSVRYLEIIRKLNQIENLTIVRGCVSGHDGSVSFSFPKQRFSEMGCVKSSAGEAQDRNFLLESPSYTLQSIVSMLPASVDHICIKIDVEGHEKSVLNSISRESLAKRIQSAVVEVHLYKFSKAAEELEKICQILSVIGEPQFLLPPQLSPAYRRFWCHLFKHYPISKLGLPSVLNLIRQGAISECHVLVTRKDSC